MTTEELTEELCRKPDYEIESALVTMMLRDKLDFPRLTQAYVKALKERTEDQNALLAEGEACVFQHLDDLRKKKLTDRQNDHVQRSLLFLKHGGHFKTDATCELFHYDEELAKSLSHYDRNRSYYSHISKGEV